jgi:hypothetical protein
VWVSFEYVCRWFMGVSVQGLRIFIGHVEHSLHILYDLAGRHILVNAPLGLYNLGFHIWTICGSKIFKLGSIEVNPFIISVWQQVGKM